MRSYENGGHGDRRRATLTRGDAQRNRERILSAAGYELERNPQASMQQVATVAGVGRSTLYRHFPIRGDLVRALRERTLTLGAGDPGAAAADAPGAGAVSAPGSAGMMEIDPLAHAPSARASHDAEAPLEVASVLEEVAPHLIPDQIVAEARRVTGVPVALYVVDIDGSHLLRLAGTDEFPARLDAPLALGPEVAPGGIPDVNARLEAAFPGCVAAPMWLRGRAVGLLLAVRAPTVALTEMAKQGAIAIELAAGYTDLLQATRRRKETSAAAELQQDLLPPRISRVSGGELAGSVLPSYDGGGDWFDFAENRDGTWLAIADANGAGLAAAGVSAVGLGAFRAARRSGADLEQAVDAVHEAMLALGGEDVHMSAVFARWLAPASMLSWVACCHPPPLLVGVNGTVEELDADETTPLGSSDRRRAVIRRERRLREGERVILYSDGIVERRTATGGALGLDGVRRAVSIAADGTAVALATAILEAVVNASREPMDDDAALLVLAVR